jgi:hypothetical protein
MAWTFTDDVAAYRAAAGGLLQAEPERHTVLLTVLTMLMRRGPAAFGPAAPLLGWWSDGGAVTAAALQTPPYPLLVTRLDRRSAAELAAVIADRGTVMPGINGTERDAAAFALAWRDVTGQQGRAHQRQRLYRLGELVPPNPAPPGAARVAAARDTAIVRSWHSAFAAEAGQNEPEPGMIDYRLSAGPGHALGVAGRACLDGRHDRRDLRNRQDRAGLHAAELARPRLRRRRHRSDHRARH